MEEEEEPFLLQPKKSKRSQILHRLVDIIALGAGNFVFGCTAAVLPFASQEFELANLPSSALLSIGIFGSWMISGPLFGHLADVYGRRIGAPESLI